MTSVPSPVVVHSRVVTLSLVAAALLGLAATSPSTTYHVLTTPSRLVEAVEDFRSHQASLRYWEGLDALANEGKPMAMYQLGRQMLRRTGTDWTGVSHDAQKGEALVRAAALHRSVDAMLWVWAEDGFDIDYLKLITDVVSSAKQPPFTLYRFAGYMHWNGVETCNDEVLEVSRLVRARLASDQEGHADFAIRQGHFEIDFAQACGRSTSQDT